MSYNQSMNDKDPLATSGLPSLNRPKELKDDTKQGEMVSTPSAGRFLILVVDDSADNVAVMSLHLQDQGYRVVTASNGEEAISVAAQTRPNLILMDISMPGMDGLAATRRIRESDELSEVPVIAVTALGTEGFQRAAYDVGVSGYLTKPVDFDRMHQLVARLLTQRESGNLT
ncbi:MAG TPA: response regulator [Pyrinomonadaceae bacterium]|nr:response regulator [Pyrinomonadaceae bacterium]